MAELRINSRAFFSNIEVLAAHVGSLEKVAVVLKDNAYGHGLLEMASLASKIGIQSAFVKNLDEAKKITAYFKEVSALYGQVSGEVPSNVHLVIHSLEQLAQIPSSQSVELKVNTGMNRNGIEQSELYAALELLKSREIPLRGVMAHNGYADDLGSEFFCQQRVFDEVRGMVSGFVKQNHLPMPRYHSLNSSGGLRSSQIKDDLVRFGIAIYGYITAHPLVAQCSQLKPILSLWAKKISTKSLPKGSRIGYSGVTALAESMSISTYDVGYGDGFYRVREGQHLLTPQGEAILPRSSMDCIAVASQQEEICLMESVESMAREFQTIPYEVLTRLSPLLPRRIL